MGVNDIDKALDVSKIHWPSSLMDWILLLIGTTPMSVQRQLVFPLVTVRIPVLVLYGAEDMEMGLASLFWLWFPNIHPDEQNASTHGFRAFGSIHLQ